MADSMENQIIYTNGAKRSALSNINKVDKNGVSKKMSLSDDDVRYEQIGNIIYMMATPAQIHEAIVAEIIRQIGNHLDGKPCRVYGSNIGLDLKDFVQEIKTLPSFQAYFKKNIKKGKEDEVFLLPDVSVLCNIDKSKFGTHGYKGVPKMIIEVTSPSTAYLDYDEKMRLYEAIGVGEYWSIIDAQNVVVYVLEDGRFVKTKFETEEDALNVPVSVFPGLSIKLDKNKVEL